MSLVEDRSPGPDPDPQWAPTRAGRLGALQDAAARLVKLLDESDPRSAAALNREYRETLREIEALAAAQEQEAARAGRRERRSFDIAAV